MNGIQFKKGSLVLLVFDIIHYDPNVWTDPEVFNPDRYVGVTFNTILCCLSVTVPFQVEKQSKLLKFLDVSLFLIVLYSRLMCKIVDSLVD